MNFEELKKLIPKGETKEIELKKSTSLLKEGIRSICGFLNHKGGAVIFGVTPNSLKVVGQDCSDNTQQEIAKELRSIEPTAHVKVDIVNIGNDKSVIILSVEEGKHKPYVYDGRPFERSLATTEKMSKHRYEQLIIENSQTGYEWDSATAEGFSIEDLDENVIWNFIHEAVSNKRLPATSLKEDIRSILEKLKLLKNDKLCNAALVLFGKELFPMFPQCELKMALFKGKERGEFLDSDVVYGNLFNLLREGEMFAKKHIPVTAKITQEQFRRIETPLLPYKAVREALLNALCHRNYMIKGGSVGLAFYSDRVEIFNNGGLLSDLTIEKIKHECSMPRNKLIADLLYKCGYIEKWGMGITVMLKECVKSGLPEPLFESDSLEFKVIFKLTDDDVQIKMKELSLTDRQTRIVEIIKMNQPIAFAELSKNFEVDLSRRTLQYDCDKLKGLGLIDLIGVGRGAKWIVK